MTIHCPSCRTIFEPRADGRGEAECPYCGRIFKVAAASETASYTPAPVAAAPAAKEAVTVLPPTETVRGGQISLQGRPGILRWTKNVAVRFTHAACSGCGRNVAKRASVCPFCGQALKKSDVPASVGFGSALRMMAIAALVFIGIPAAIIVFILVVLAPEGGDVAPKARRPVAAKPLPKNPGSPNPELQAGAKSGKADESQATRGRGPLSVLRSLRDRLRGTEHGSSSVPAKAPLQKAGDGASDAHVPPVGPGDSQQVKPDPTP